MAELWVQEKQAKIEQLRADLEAAQKEHWERVNWILVELEGLVREVDSDLFPEVKVH